MLRDEISILWAQINILDTQIGILWAQASTLGVHKMLLLLI